MARNCVNASAKVSKGESKSEIKTIIPRFRTNSAIRRNGDPRFVSRPEGGLSNDSISFFYANAPADSAPECNRESRSSNESNPSRRLVLRK